MLQSQPNRFASVILAAGLGFRLGSDEPKGLLVVADKTLFQWQLEKIPEGNPVALLVAPQHVDKVKAFLQETRWSHAEILVSNVVPMLKASGEILEAPVGNGDLFRSLSTSGVLQKWIDEGVEYIHITPIDNPLANPNPEIDEGEWEISLQCVSCNKKESLGRIVEKESKLYVREYFELTEAEEEIDLAFTNLMTLKIEYIKRTLFRDISWHVNQRDGQIKFEKFLFDYFPYANSYQIKRVPRNESFAPIKTQDDIARVEEILYTRSV